MHCTSVLSVLNSKSNLFLWQLSRNQGVHDWVAGTSTCNRGVDDHILKGLFIPTGPTGQGVKASFNEVFVVNSKAAS